MLIFLNTSSFSTSGASTVCVWSLCQNLMDSCMYCPPNPITLPKTRPNMFSFWFESSTQNTTRSTKNQLVSPATWETKAISRSVNFLRQFVFTVYLLPVGSKFLQIYFPWMQTGACWFHEFRLSTSIDVHLLYLYKKTKITFGYIYSYLCKLLIRKVQSMRIHSEEFRVDFRLREKNNAKHRSFEEPLLLSFTV
jgi:hypothetical protein